MISFIFNALEFDLELDTDPSDYQNNERPPEKGFMLLKNNEITNFDKISFFTHAVCSR